MEDRTTEAPLDPRLIEQAVEALVFTADEPLSAEAMAGVIAEVTGAAVDPAAVEAAVEALNTAYETQGRVLRLYRWGGGYRMATVPAVAPFVQAYVHPRRTQRLSRSLLETLAILAYRQPATKPEIDAVRGVDSDYALRKLLELGLIDVVGRSDSLGRPLLYGTTPRFLDVFGLDGLDALPSLREVEDILGEAAFSKERAELLKLQAMEAQTANGAAHPSASSDDQTDDAP
ncbi:SMC-Scp complex subunit ScpB [Rhodothermaceae bacterium RA]|nr:SMC-Scp complex subunit ScpB [Rhodothermaceae bacterium RA]